MKKQIFDKDEAIGKTIESAICSANCNDIVLSFTDGTFLYLVAGFDEVSGLYLGSRDELRVVDFDGDLVNAGILSRVEMDEATDKATAEFKKQELESNRKQYDSLRLLFEGDKT